MNRSRLELRPGFWLDYRRALFLSDFGVLCVADTHLGYHWAHRHAGQMMPIPEEDRTAARLEELCGEYRPARVVILGDVVHRAVPAPQLRSELASFVRRVSGCCKLELVTGNHDRGLELVLPHEMVLHKSLELDSHLLLHGDAPVPAGNGHHILMGHEHPAICLGDGVSSAKFPCFVCGPKITILPAFSQWAAGAEIRGGRFMSDIARRSKFTQAIAILGAKLLPVALS